MKNFKPIPKDIVPILSLLICEYTGCQADGTVPALDPGNGPPCPVHGVTTCLRRYNLAERKPATGLPVKRDLELEEVLNRAKGNALRQIDAVADRGHGWLAAESPLPDGRLLVMGVRLESEAREPMLMPASIETFEDAVHATATLRVMISNSSALTSDLSTVPRAQAELQAALAALDTARTMLDLASLSYAQALAASPGRFA